MCIFMVRGVTRGLILWRLSMPVRGGVDGYRKWMGREPDW